MPSKEKTYNEWVAMTGPERVKQKVDEAFDPMDVRADRQNEVFRPDPVAPPDMTLRGSMAASHPFQISAAKKSAIMLAESAAKSAEQAKMYGYKPQYTPEELAQMMIAAQNK